MSSSYKTSGSTLSHPFDRAVDVLTPLLLDNMDGETKDLHDMGKSPAASDARSVSVESAEKTQPWWSYFWVSVASACSARGASTKLFLQDYEPSRTAEETKFIRKLDIYLLLILSLGYFIKNLDRECLPASNASTSHHLNMQ